MQKIYDVSTSYKPGFYLQMEKIFYHVQKDDFITLDLSNLNFCLPYAICALYLLINQWRNDGAEITIIPPQNNDCRSHNSEVRAQTQ